MMVEAALVHLCPRADLTHADGVVAVTVERASAARVGRRVAVRPTLASIVVVNGVAGDDLLEPVAIEVGQRARVAEADVLQARWGTHGDHPIIVLAVSSVIDSFNITINAFNLSEKYRVPVE